MQSMKLPGILRFQIVLDAKLSYLSACHVLSGRPSRDDASRIITLSKPSLKPVGLFGQTRHLKSLKRAILISESGSVYKNRNKYNMTHSPQTCDPNDLQIGI